MKKYMLVSLLCVAALDVMGQEEERFKVRELELSPFLTYVDKTGDNWGAGASATYFLTDKIGVGASTYWTDFGGTFIDNLAGEAYYRLPLFELVAPYAVGGIGYQFDSEEWFESLGAGVDFRPFENISAFSDIQYRFANKTRDGVFLRLGVRFAF